MGVAYKDRARPPPRGLRLGVGLAISLGLGLGLGLALGLGRASMLGPAALLWASFGSNFLLL